MREQIIVMDHGRIVERGTHAELLRAGGLFAQMWALQQQRAAEPRRSAKPGRRHRARMKKAPMPRGVGASWCQYNAIYSVACTAAILTPPCVAPDIVTTAQRSHCERSATSRPNAQVASTPKVAKPI